MGKIKLLSDDIINQIAAGEIVEKPSSALKEIVENSIDANAKNIEIFLENGGKSKIVVKDDGEGLLREDLSMCIKRHATSKLKGINLFEINNYGFRGEAIPSIASVSKFKIESNGFGIEVNFSDVSEIFPSKIKNGTVVSIENLFEKIPARLKFLKTDSVELSSCLSVIENFAITMRDVNFEVVSKGVKVLSFKNDSIEERISKIFSQDLFKKSIYFEEENETIRVYGYLFHPLDNKYSQSHQKIFINNRIVKDKTVSMALKNAYKDLIIPGRYPAAVIFIKIDPFHVDVNISPTKSEIRFRDNYYVQNFLTDSIRKNLKKFDRVLIDFKEEIIKKEPISIKNDFFEIKKAVNEMPVFVNTPVVVNKPAEEEKIEIKVIEEKENFFGRAICQVFDSYIISEKDNQIIIIDQHAVNEKIKQESIIKNINFDNKQFLIKPEIVEINNSEKAKLNIDNLKECGFSIEIIGNSLMISAIPSVLSVGQAITFLKGLIESEDISLIDVIRENIANIACKNSIKAGKKLSIHEMNSILEIMENTYSIHQCNHHRPSFVAITKEGLDKMFERK